MRCLVPGSGRGPVLNLVAPLSFWGGVDADGMIKDRLHPQRGAMVAGRILLMPPSKGSSSSSSVLAELIRAGNGPAGMVVFGLDAVVVIGALVANELYETGVPVVYAGSLTIADNHFCELVARPEATVSIRHLTDD